MQELDGCPYATERGHNLALIKVGPRGTSHGLGVLVMLNGGINVGTFGVAVLMAGGSSHTSCPALHTT
jgi:hypothetical protein